MSRRIKFTVALRGPVVAHTCCTSFCCTAHRTVVLRQYYYFLIVSSKKLLNCFMCFGLNGSANGNSKICNIHELSLKPKTYKYDVWSQYKYVYSTASQKFHKFNILRMLTLPLNVFYPLPFHFS